MILIQRTSAPAELATIQTTQLAKLRELIRTSGREPISDEIDGYRIPAICEKLLEMQGGKCCYCERHILEKFYDVEHYRPKTRAIRQNTSRDGCDETHGYWWLAFTWDNLLYACPICNRIHKNTFFPLANGSIALTAENAPPGNERPLLLDPCGDINPVEHIEFHLDQTIPTIERWNVRPRNGSPLGQETIRVLGLDTKAYITKHTSIIETRIKPKVKRFDENWSNPAIIEALFLSASDMFSPGWDYSALHYDALRHYIPNARLYACIQQCWPEPGQVGQKIMT